MTNRAIANSIKAGVILFAVLVAVGVWYFTLGRKPKLVLAAKLEEKAGLPGGEIVGPGEMLVVTGQKAILYDLGSGETKWWTNLDRTGAGAAPDARVLKLQEWATEL